VERLEKSDPEPLDVAASTGRYARRLNAASVIAVAGAGSVEGVVASSV